MRVIFVCTGNTCRSPMAEKLFEDMTKDVEGIEVESRGVMCSEGMPMAFNASVTMREMNLDTKHSSKAITKEDIANADYVITMTASHKMYIEEAFGKNDNVHTIAELSDSSDVADPYGGNIDVYRACANELKDKLMKIKDKILNKIS